jgi:hypothetical protein
MSKFSDSREETVQISWWEIMWAEERGGEGSDCQS